MRLAAVLLATVVATPALAPASADAATSAAKKCKKGTVAVKTGRKGRCIKLRVAPSRPKDADRGILLVDIELPAGDAPARVTWHLRQPDVGDVPPTISECEPFPLSGPLPDPVTTQVSRNVFLEPGTHTIAVDAPATVPALGGVGTINSTAGYALTFKRVNEDGSPYTG